MDRKKLRSTLLRLVGPVLLVVVVLKMPHREAIEDTLLHASALPLVAVFFLNFVSLEFKVWRWDFLLRARDIRYPIGRARIAYYASLYVGMLTPGRVGDVLRIQYLRADLGTPYVEGLASIVMDRLCDLYVLAAFVAYAIFRYAHALATNVPVQWITWALVAATILGPLVLLVPGVAERIAAIAFRRFSSAKIEGGFTQFLAAMRANVGRQLLVTLPLTVLAFAVNYVQGYLLARAIHIDISFVDAMCLLAIASLLGLLPISISGVGVRELLFALILPSLGYGPEAGVSFGILVFVAIYLACVAVGFIAWLIRPPPARDPDRALT